MYFIIFIGKFLSIRHNLSNKIFILASLPITATQAAILEFSIKIQKEFRYNALHIFAKYIFMRE